MSRGTRGSCSPLDERIQAVLGKLGQLPDTPHDSTAMERARRENIDAGGATRAITGEDLHNIIHDRLGDTQALAIVRRWIGSAYHGRPTSTGRPVPHFLVLHGGRGRGKTVAGVWAMANERGYYVTAGEYRRQRYSFDALDLERRYRAQRAGFLVLDDLGFEVPDKRDQEWLFELLNERQDAHSYTLITTNEDPDVWLKDRYGDRVAERIEHQGALVRVIGPALRAKWQSVVG